MPSAFSNPRESRAPGCSLDTVVVEPDTQSLIESDIEPRWGQLLRTWEALAEAKGRCPSKSEVDPMALGSRLLPNVFLVDVVPMPARKRPRFRFRLLGQDILDRTVTRAGDYLDALGATTEVAKIERHYVAAMEGRIAIRETNMAWSDPDKDYQTYSVLVLPLSDDGARVTHLIGLAIYAP